MKQQLEFGNIRASSQTKCFGFVDLLNLLFPFLAGDEEKKKKIPPRQYPVSNPPPWIPKPEVSVVSVQPQDSLIKDDDEIPYSSSDEEEIVTVKKKNMNVKTL